MDNPFVGLSKSSLQNLFLARLGILAGARKDCRYFKRRLQLAREEQRSVRLELEQLEFAIQQFNVVQFPKKELVPEKIPDRKRIHGRWGKVTFESPAEKQPAKRKSTA